MPHAAFSTGRRTIFSAADFSRAALAASTLAGVTANHFSASTARTIAITGRSYRLKDHAAIVGKEDKNKKTKSKSNEPLTAEPAS